MRQYTNSFSSQHTARAYYIRVYAIGQFEVGFRVWYDIAMAGYSQTPLIKKLGLDSLTQTQPVFFLDPPYTFFKEVGDLSHLKILAQLEPAFYIHWFVTDYAFFKESLPLITQNLDKQGLLWISWPKKSAQKEAGIESDIDENLIREAILELELVDVKVCAIDDIWSGLKCVWRKGSRR